MYNKQYLSYLPEYLRRIREIKAIAAAVDEMLAALVAKNDYLVKEGIVLTAEEIGLEMWERLLSLSSDGDVEERRMLILSFLSGRLPYTFTSVKNALEILCGKGRFVMEYGEKPYTLRVRVALDALYLQPVIKKMMKRVLPANISFSCVPDYNTHRVVAGRTHQQLAEFTHNGLFKEVI